MGWSFWSSPRGLMSDKDENEEEKKEKSIESGEEISNIEIRFNRNQDDHYTIFVNMLDNISYEIYSNSRSTLRTIVNYLTKPHKKTFIPLPKLPNCAIRKFYKEKILDDQNGFILNLNHLITIDFPVNPRSKIKNN